MTEIGYSIGEIKASMFVSQEHTFYLSSKEWIMAGDLAVGDEIIACSGAVARVGHINETEGEHKLPDLKASHNHHYFVTAQSGLGGSTLRCDKAPEDPLELIPYTLANRPSNLPDGKPTGHHAGPWVAARYIHGDSGVETIGYGRASDSMCAEDAAVSDLRLKLGSAAVLRPAAALSPTTVLNRANVEISHAYVRKYARKGRLINKMSPCMHCRNNYGSALNDKTMGSSNLSKEGRGYLPAL